MKWELVVTVDQAEAMRRALSSAPAFYWDTETTGLQWIRTRVFMVSFSTGNQTWVIPVNRFEQKYLEGLFQDIFSHPQQACCAHNLKFDMHQMRQTFGTRIKTQLNDTLIMAYLLDENRVNKLKTLLAELLQMPVDENDEIKCWLKKTFGAEKNWKFDQVPEEITAPYSAKDAWGGFKLWELFAPQIKALGFEELYTREMEVIQVLFDMEQAGVKVDPDHLSLLKIDYESQIKDNKDRLFAEVGHELDLASNDEVTKLFYEELRMPLLRKTLKGAPAVDEWALEGMDHPAAELLINHRHLEKLLGTYVMPMLEFKDAKNLVHADYSITRTRTGRFGCSGPNLQNVIKDKKFRKAFIYEAGEAGYYFDYSQGEMRGMAHYSKDPVLCDIFRKGLDIYTATGAELFGVPLDKVTKDQRYGSKGMNLAIIYGVGKDRLAGYINGYMEGDYKVTSQEAQAWKAQYFKRMPDVRYFMYKVMDTVKLNREPFGHHVRNSYGRVRRLAVDKAYTGINHLIQGWLADVMRIGMVRVAKKLNLTIKQNIHDAIRVDIPLVNGEHNLELLREVNRELTNFPEIRVPMTADLEWSKTNWGEVQGLDLE